MLQWQVISTYKESMSWCSKTRLGHSVRSDQSVIIFFFLIFFLFIASIVKCTFYSYLFKTYKQSNLCDYDMFLALKSQ